MPQRWPDALVLCGSTNSDEAAVLKDARAMDSSLVYIHIDWGDRTVEAVSQTDE